MMCVQKGHEKRGMMKIAGANDRQDELDDSSESAGSGSLEQDVVTFDRHADC